MSWGLKLAEQTSVLSPELTMSVMALFPSLRLGAC